MSRGDVSTSGWVQPLAALLIDEVGQRLPEPERVDRGREWIAEVHAILDDHGHDFSHDHDFGRWRRSVRVLRFAVGQYRTVGRVVARSRSVGVGRPGRSKYDGGYFALPAMLADPVCGGGPGTPRDRLRALARVAMPSGPAAPNVGETTICPLQAAAPPMVPDSGPWEAEACSNFGGPLLSPSWTRTRSRVRIHVCCASAGSGRR